MPDKSPTTSTPDRSLGDIIRERRTSNYPQKHQDAIDNEVDRRNFLIAAYTIITKRDP